MTTQLTPELINNQGTQNLPALLGLCMLEIESGRARMEMAVRPELMAPNGFLHAGSVISLADTAAGYGCMASLPEGASSFTTIELKSNMLGTAREGMLVCDASCVHAGRTTQVWESVVKHVETGKVIARFSCTQMILYPR
jgi:uncharacterized protein (TIGR00369 family)